jgi:outer membrane protein assembly factor BamE (lipoprotein component of BamABCDE complex)
MKKIFSILILFSVMACASGGNQSLKGQTQETISQKIKVGNNKQQVTAVFGSPSDVSFTDSRNEIWKYEYIDASSKPQNFVPFVNLINSGMEGQKYLLAVFFNKNGIVENYSYSSSEYETNQGIMGK